jgi:biotin carboxyl carrier protein
VKFKIHIDSAGHEIEANAEGKLKLDGRDFQGKTSSPAGDRRIVQVGDGSYEVRVVENCVDTGVFILELAGERIPVTVTDVSKNAAPVGAAASGGANGVAQAAGAEGNGGAGNGAAASAIAPEEVKEGVWAPVPGKIVDVFVKVGDAVDEGAPVLILEAMKMENELHAPKKGTIAAVLVKKGDQAEKGQLLVAFE